MQCLQPVPAVVRRGRMTTRPGGAFAPGYYSRHLAPTKAPPITGIGARVCWNQHIRRAGAEQGGVRVNSNGQVSLPPIGGMMAGGKTIPEFEAELAKVFRGIPAEPAGRVFVKEFTNQRITLRRGNAKPGIYPITGRTSFVAGHCAGRWRGRQAGGPGGIVLMRKVAGKRQAAVYDFARGAQGHRGSATLRRRHHRG